jgi:hypothetical protein
MKSVIDLSTQYQHLDLWYDNLEFIVETAGVKKHNYIDLDPLDYKSFTAVVEDNVIICFSALQVSESRWGSKIGRCSTRMWIHPLYRMQGMKKFSGGNKFLNSTYCLPVQMEKARELDLDYVFISREDNLLGFQAYINLIKINTNEDFTLLPNKYNICGHEDVISNSCKQYVAVKCLNNNRKHAWDAVMEKFKL